MPNEIVILLDDEQADYEERENMPFSLSKKTDKILEIVGADGIEIDNPFESVILPATKNNHSIYDQIALLHQVSGAIFIKDTKALANGVLFFSGSSILKKISNRHYPESLVLEMIGDGLSVWSQLEGVSLRDLDLGLEEWGIANIEVSWIATPTTGFSGIFAPVFYAKTSGTGAPGAWHQRDFRLHVYFYTILKGIFETYLGYSLVSTFFETAWFQRWVYLFGVGNDVQFDNLPTVCSVHVYRIPGVAGTTDPIQFHLEYEDTCSEWDEVGGTTMTAAPPTSPSTYTVEFTGQGTNWGTFEIEINSVVVFSTGPSYTIGGAQYFQIIKQFSLATGDTLTVHAYTDGLGTMFLYSLSLQVYTTPQPWEGSDIIVSSCLHDEPVKKFVRSITQMFCLAWNVNNVTKQVFCEPRFPYKIYASGTFTTYDGFYQNPDDPSALEEIGAGESDISFETPFGKELIMSYAKDENNPLFETYLADNQNPGIPIFGVNKPFNTTDGKSTESENELFVPLLLSSPDVAHATGGYLPTILPDGYEITGESPPTTEATYRGKPTCGLVFAGAIEAFWDNSGTEVSMPLVSQSKPYLIDGSHNDDLNIGTFADMTAQPVETGQIAQDVYGLASTFYTQYFECLKPAVLISLRYPLSLVGFSTENFRSCKLLQLNGEKIIAIHLEISNFNPANMEPVSMLFLKWAGATANEAADITHNPVEIAPPSPTGICCDASAAVSKNASDAEITITACRDIKNAEVFVNNVKVYSGDLTAGTFGDASVDSNGVITIDSAAIGTGVFTFTVNVKQDGCEVKQSVRVLEY